MAFVHSLQFSADTAGQRKPLLRKEEFEEALVRLAYAYEAPSGARGLLEPIGATKKGRPQNRFSTSAVASSVSAAVRSTLGSRRAAPPADDPVAAEIEATVLGKLPLVLGKLLAVLADDERRPGSLMA